MKIKVQRFEDVDQAREYAKLAIDEAAEAARARYITSGSGQAMEYQEAYRQAQEFLANPAASAPMVMADVLSETINPSTDLPVASVGEAASLIVFMYEQWTGVGTEIRRLRLAGKASVKTAATAAEVAHIRETTIAGLNAL